MNGPLHVDLIAANSALAETLRLLLPGAPDAILRHVVPASGAPTPPAPPGARQVALLAPRRWEELKEWLAGPLSGFVSLPWLLFADLYLSGMFLERFSGQRCTLVAPHWSGEELWVALRVIATGHALLPPRALPKLFATRWEAERGKRVALTAREFECGCAGAAAHQQGDRRLPQHQRGDRQGPPEQPVSEAGDPQPPGRRQRIQASAFFLESTLLMGKPDEKPTPGSEGGTAPEAKRGSQEPARWKPTLRQAVELPSRRS